MRGRNLKKFLDAIDLLGQPCGTTIVEMENKLGIKRRAVYHLLEFLQDEMQFFIHEETSDIEGGKRFRLDKEHFKRLSGMKLVDLNLSISEVIALNFIRGSSQLYKDTEIEKNINSAFAKLDYFVPDGTGKKIESIKSLFVASGKFAKDYSDKEEIISSLTAAMLERKSCLVSYHSFYDDRVKKFDIDPLHFFERDGGLYLVVNTTSYGDIRLLAVERIQSIEMTDKAFDYPQDFDPVGLLQSSFGLIYDDPVEAKIWFSADQARYIKERKWGNEQKITENPDGSITLELKTSGKWEVKKWILSFGVNAELLAPEKLRNEMCMELQRSLDHYVENRSEYIE